MDGNWENQKITTAIPNLFIIYNKLNETNIGLNLKKYDT